MDEKKRVKCPYCGYAMPVFYDKETVASRLWIKCKGRNCRRIIKINISVK